MIDKDATVASIVRRERAAEFAAGSWQGCGEWQGQTQGSGDCYRQLARLAKSGRENHGAAESAVWVQIPLRIKDAAGKNGSMGFSTRRPYSPGMDFYSKKKRDKYDKQALLALIIWYESHRLDVSERAAWT